MHALHVLAGNLSRPQVCELQMCDFPSRGFRGITFASQTVRNFNARYACRAVRCLPGQRLKKGGTVLYASAASHLGARGPRSVTRDHLTFGAVCRFRVEFLSVPNVASSVDNILHDAAHTLLTNKSSLARPCTVIK